MRFFHLSDLHIGRQLHHYNLYEDQKHILDEVAGLAEQMRPDAVLIAGDVYDKSVPSAEAVSLFDDFLTKLSSAAGGLPVLIIAGNHDSARRLDYASRLLGSRRIYIAGNVPEKEEDHLKKVTLTDEFGEVDFYLLPFLKPGYLRWMEEGEEVRTYTDAVRAVLEREEIDYGRRNVLLSHQFYAGGGSGPETCDSEILSVGGIDQVDVSVISRFDYAALGHLHGAQRAGGDRIRYCGTLLKYSVSEENHKKSLHLVELAEKGEPVKVTQIPLHPLRDVRRVRGELKEILEGAESSGREDYVSVTLTDETEPYKPKEQLEKAFRNILEIRIDNERTRKKLDFSDEEIRIEDPLTSFADFFREMNGRDLSQSEMRIMRQICENSKGDAS